MCSTHYLIMDEPFSGLDPLMKRRATEVITKVASMDTLNTIIVNSHDVTEGCAIADTVWLMGVEPDQPGARIVQTIDMAALGFAWRPDILHDHGFLDLVASIKDQFAALSGRA
jgi:polar amino acid transport system ATP-binding protein/sulfate transport system ATP-binding protein